MKELEDTATSLSRERAQLIKQREEAIQETHLWRSELTKTKDNISKLEATVARAEDKIRAINTNTEAKLKAASQKELVFAQEKEQLISYINSLKSQLHRFVHLFFSRR